MMLPCLSYRPPWLVSGKKAKVGASVSAGQGPPSSSSSEPKAGFGPRWYEMEASLTHVMPYLNLTDIVRFHMVGWGTEEKEERVTEGISLHADAATFSWQTLRGCT